MDKFKIDIGEKKLTNKHNIRNKLAEVVGLESIEENDFVINFKLPPVSIEGKEMTAYSVPNSPHIFHCDQVILYDNDGKAIANFDDMNVMCMHGINDGTNHLSSENQNITISDIIQKAEINMKGNKIDVLAICNKNSGIMEFYGKNEYRRISALDSEVSVSLMKNNQTALIEIELSLNEKGGEFTNIEEMKEQKIMKDMEFERK